MDVSEDLAIYHRIDGNGLKKAGQLHRAPQRLTRLVRNQRFDIPMLQDSRRFGWSASSDDTEHFIGVVFLFFSFFMLLALFTHERCYNFVRVFLDQPARRAPSS